MTCICLKMSVIPETETETELSRLDWKTMKECRQETERAGEVVVVVVIIVIT